MLARRTSVALRAAGRGASSQVARAFWSGVNGQAVAQKPPPAAADPNMETLSIAETERLLFNGIKSIGYSDADAAVMRDAMMWAQLRDNNQGIIKLTSGGLAKTGDGQPTLEIETPTGGRLNGNQAMSMVVMNQAVELAIEKALANNSAGIVGTFNTSQSMGAVGFYAEKIAAKGLIGVTFATSPEFVAPHGAKQPILGTNPITCAVPTDQGLFLMDQATAGFPWFGLLEAKTAGREIPEGVAFDKDGQPTRDPAAALQGALRTFDRGYKSSNLAMMVELLAGPLVGGAHMDKRTAKNWGNLIIAINPALLGDPATFYKSAGEVLERVRTAEKLPGVTEILIPGQREAALAAERQAPAAGGKGLEKASLERHQACGQGLRGLHPVEEASGASRSPAWWFPRTPPRDLSSLEARRGLRRSARALCAEPASPRCTHRPRASCPSRRTCSPSCASSPPPTRRRSAAPARPRRRPRAPPPPACTPPPPPTPSASRLGSRTPRARARATRTTRRRRCCIRRPPSSSTPRRWRAHTTTRARVRAPPRLRALHMTAAPPRAQTSSTASNLQHRL